jgi:hypothetical protein
MRLQSCGCPKIYSTVFCLLPPPQSNHSSAANNASLTVASCSGCAVRRVAGTVRGGQRVLCAVPPPLGLDQDRPVNP